MSSDSNLSSLEGGVSSVHDLSVNFSKPVFGKIFGVDENSGVEYLSLSFGVFEIGKEIRGFLGVGDGGEYDRRLFIGLCNNIGIT